MKALWMAISLACALPALAQAQRTDDLEPAVNTSKMPPPQPAAPSATASAPAAGAASDTAPAKAPARTASAPAAAKAAPTDPKAAKSGKALDRLDLDTTQITGNKELPKVMYVVPWKHSDLGDLTGKPANSLVDEILQPVDRDVFNREERYYHTVASEKAPPTPPSGTPAVK